jgi:hypothetical protein
MYVHLPKSRRINDLVRWLTAARTGRTPALRADRPAGRRHDPVRAAASEHRSGSPDAWPPVNMR